MNYKYWYQSKTVWFNVILTITEVAAMMSETMPDGYKMGLLAVQGVGNIVLRVWFTNSSIDFNAETL